MALNLQYEFAYTGKPIVPIRLTNGGFCIDTEALLDTGADVTLIDAQLAADLNVPLISARSFQVVGVTGRASRTPYSWLQVAVLGLLEELAVDRMAVGFVPGLTKTIGNLLGRNVFEHFDFGLHHTTSPSQRRTYLGGM